MDYNLNFSKFSVAMSDDINNVLLTHLSRKDGQEDLCFALYNPSSGQTRFTGIIEEVLLPLEEEREVHGNVSFLPSYYERVLFDAMKKKKGIALLHSHPLASTWQMMSDDDFEAENGISKSIFAATKLPLIGMTLSVQTGFWSGRVWHKTSTSNNFQFKNCENIRVLGQKIKFHFCPKIKNSPEIPESLKRTLHSWGKDVQSDIARVRVGIVGLGSVGSLVLECLARTGFTEVKLFDFDHIKQHNLDRTLHAYQNDVDNKEPKVKIATQASIKSATMKIFKVLPISKGIQNPTAYLEALDCDIIFSCVDRPWGRSILNFITKAHLIPCIDGGIGAFRKKTGQLRTAEWGVHSVLTESRCLECLQQFQSSDIALERDGLLDDPSYIESLPEDSPYKRNENVFLFSMALASDMVLEAIKSFGNISGRAPSNRKRFIYPHSIIENEIKLSCNENCSFNELKGLGDSAGHPGTE